MPATVPMMGGENLSEIQFDDCELPLENVILREDGFRKLMSIRVTSEAIQVHGGYGSTSATSTVFSE